MLNINLSSDILPAIIFYFQDLELILLAMK